MSLAMEMQPSSERLCTCEGSAETSTTQTAAASDGCSRYVGFLFVLFVATLTAIIEQQTLMRASVDCGATTFQQMCQRTPAWARQTTIWSGLIYLWACGGFYFDFLEAFFEGQLCPVLCASNGDVWLCQSRCYLDGWRDALKTVVIVAAILKGFLTWSTKTETFSYVTWRPIGFFRVTSILMSSLANTGILPQLASDVQPELRDKVTTWCPTTAVTLQSTVYVVVALVGYAALGSAVDLDLFKVYEAG
eukprot:s529_g4.t1